MDILSGEASLKTEIASLVHGAFLKGQEISILLHFSKLHFRQHSKGLYVQKSKQEVMQDRKSVV